MRTQTEFLQRQRGLASNWDKFGPVLHDYLGIPYKGGGRAVQKVTGAPTGVATREAGLVCTSFVDVVMSRYLFDDAEEQLDSYKFGIDRNIFDAYGARKLRANVEPNMLQTVVNQKQQLYGIVFHMKNAWIKRTPSGNQPREPGSRIHVGFLAFKNDNLFLIHASGRKGVHIVAWKRFLMRQGPKLEKFGGQQLRGPKELTVYVTGTA